MNDASFSIVVVAEGAEPEPGTMPHPDYPLDENGYPRLGGISNMVAPEIEKRTGFATRVTILGHLQRGSVAVHVGEIMELGDVIGLVGNSGNTGEPHLHVHAQRPGSTVAPLSGVPVPIRLGGRYVVRNDRVRADREGS